jgi:hypothetical protein
LQVVNFSSEERNLFIAWQTIESNRP